MGPVVGVESNCFVSDTPWGTSSMGRFEWLAGGSFFGSQMDEGQVILDLGVTERAWKRNPGSRWSN